RSGYEGDVFRLSPGAGLAYAPARKRVPLLIGTWSLGLTALAADQADELKLGGTANPAVIRLVRERLGPTDVGIVPGAVTVVDQDGPRAREVARRRVAMYLDVVARLDTTVAFDSELLSALEARVAARDAEGAARLISDETLDLFAFSGTPAQVAGQAEALFEAGARRGEVGSPQGAGEGAGPRLLAPEGAPPPRGHRAAEPGPPRPAGRTKRPG